MKSTTVTSKGQVTIPKPVRDLLGILAGSRVDFRRAPDGRVVLTRADKKPRSQSCREAAGAGRQGADDGCDHGADAR